jgi:general secretion pathway protein C
MKVGMANWGADWPARIAALGMDKRLPLLASLAMILLLAQALAALTWTLLPRPAVQALPPAAVKAPLGKASAARNQPANIAAWHLFGEVQKEAPQPLPQVTDAPDTSLNLKLLGVVASDNPATARAIIADGKGVEEAYGVNDNLPGGASLREIYADRVLLEYRGRLEALRLPKEIPEGAVGMGTGRHQGGNRAAPVTPMVGANTSALLRQYRDALTNNPASLMNLVRAMPVRDGPTGRIKGYRISPGRDRSLLSRFGLRTGDIVTAVNGVTLDNPIKALEIMRDLSSANQVTLEVERNGAPQTFAFQIE